MFLPARFARGRRIVSAPGTADIDGFIVEMERVNMLRQSRRLYLDQPLKAAVRGW
jgi:hypothetical protein